MLSKISIRSFWYAFFGLSILFLFINLEFLPIAWFDEVMDLEPVGRWFLTGKHASIAWPMQGAGEHSMVNLPMREAPHFIAMAFFGPSIWGLRFVFFILWLLAGTAFFKVLGQIDVAKPLQFFALALVFLDKGTLEMMRGCRPEIIEMVFIYWGIYFILQHKFILSAACFIALAWVHPAVWFISLGLGLYSFYYASRRAKATIVGLLVLSIVGFSFFIQGNLTLFYKQFSMSAGAHTPHYGWLRRLVEHISMRFVHYWRIEFWWLALFIGAHIWLFTRWQSQNSFWRALQLSIVATSLYWLFTLLPNYRYVVAINGLLLLQFISAWPTWWPRLSQKGVQALCLAIVMASFIPRAGIALWQRQERNPHLVLNWLNKELPSQNTLLIGESIGSYWSLQHPNTAFIHETQPQNAHFSDFKQVYFLSHNKSLPILSGYPIQTNKPLLGIEVQGKTYAGLHLYKVQSQVVFDSIVAKGMEVNYFYD